MIDDMADSRLLDLRGVSLEELLNVDEPGFMSALDGIVAPQRDGEYDQFGSSI
jgi:hypothetical protein